MWLDLLDEEIPPVRSVHKVHCWRMSHESKTLSEACLPVSLALLVQRLVVCGFREHVLCVLDRRNGYERTQEDLYLSYIITLTVAEILQMNESVLRCI